MSLPYVVPDIVSRFYFRMVRQIPIYEFRKIIRTAKEKSARSARYLFNANWDFDAFMSFLDHAVDTVEGKSGNDPLTTDASKAVSYQEFIFRNSNEFARYALKFAILYLSMRLTDPNAVNICVVIYLGQLPSILSDYQNKLQPLIERVNSPGWITVPDVVLLHISIGIISNKITKKCEGALAMKSGVYDARQYRRKNAASACMASYFLSQYLAVHYQVMMKASQKVFDANWIMRTRIMSVMIMMNLIELHRPPQDIKVRRPNATLKRTSRKMNTFASRKISHIVIITAGSYRYSLEFHRIHVQY